MQDKADVCVKQTDDNHPSLRIIIDPPLAGAANMAIDEAILEAVNTAAAPPTLRFYRWAQPTISLGYFQRRQEFLDQDDKIRQLPMVRRQTGGGAILHDDELTYSLTLPLDETPSPPKITDMYKLVHDAFIAALAQWGIRAEYRGGEKSDSSRSGPFFCFARQHQLDVVVGNDKLLGSAQRRIKKAVLQHGSLILARHFPQQPSAAVTASTAQPFDLNSFISAVVTPLATHLLLTPVTGALTQSEQQRQTQLQKKYLRPQWNHQR